MGDLPNLANFTWVDRVNRAVDYVTQNLASPLRLEEVARAASVSPYHFHRIFRALMGETLASFVKRTRLERSLYLMSHHRESSLTEIALSCGFSSSSDFSRSFRSHYGVPPRRFDVDGWRDSNRAAMADALASPREPRRLQRLPEGTNPDGFTARLLRLPERQVAYIRVADPYRGDRVPEAAARLVAWATERRLDDGQWLGYQWDDPEIVPLEKCRYDVGLEVSMEVAGGGEVSIAQFPACLVAEVDIAGSIGLELRALDWLYSTWLPNSRYVPDDLPVFEAWNDRPFAHGREYFELRIQLPVIDTRHYHLSDALSRNSRLQGP